MFEDALNVVQVIAEEPAASSTSVQSFRAQLAHKNSARAEGRAAVREGQRMLLEKLAILAARARGSEMKDVERVASDAQQAGVPICCTPPMKNNSACQASCYRNCFFESFGEAAQQQRSTREDHGRERGVAWDNW